MYGHKLIIFDLLNQNIKHKAHINDVLPVLKNISASSCSSQSSDQPNVLTGQVSCQFHISLYSFITNI